MRVRTASKVDSNQPAIVQAARNMGASVHHLNKVGDGMPDLLIGFLGNNLLWEVKNPKTCKPQNALTDDQKVWHMNYQGNVDIIWTIEEAIEKLRKCKRVPGFNKDMRRGTGSVLSSMRF